MVKSFKAQTAAAGMAFMPDYNRPACTWFGGLLKPLLKDGCTRSTIRKTTGSGHEARRCCPHRNQQGSPEMDAVPYIKDLILPGGDKAGMGKLREEDYILVGQLLNEFGFVKKIPELNVFYRGLQ